MAAVGTQVEYHERNDRDLPAFVVEVDTDADPDEHTLYVLAPHYTDYVRRVVEGTDEGQFTEPEV